MHLQRVFPCTPDTFGKEGAPKQPKTIREIRVIRAEEFEGFLARITQLTRNVLGSTPILLPKV